MRLKRKHIISVATVFSLLLMTPAYAEVPDPYQNSGSNNIAYDLPSKFYMGFNVGYSALTEKSVTVSGKSTTIEDNALDFGLFGGYQFNRYLNIEANFQRLGTLKESSGSSTLPLSYQASLYNLSLDGIIHYPFLSRYQYTVSFYGKAGYGFTFTRYQYDADNGADRRSGAINRGAYQIGLGFTVDLRSNVSARLGYTYYQTQYPLPGHGSSHGANVLTLGFYYNFY